MTVEFEELEGSGLRIPAAGFGLLLAQPRVELSAHEPFRWEGGKRQAQLEAVSRVLTLAAQPPPSVGPIHFTVFPEFSVPGLDGIAMIDAAMAANNWQVGTVVIAGIDGLSKADYGLLCSAAETRVAAPNAPANVAESQWVNCCVIFVKQAEGKVDRWVQPKLAPAEDEWATCYQQMFLGQAVHVFRGQYDNGSAFIFFTMICFDWIARRDGNLRWREVLKDLDARAKKARADYPLSAVFIPQNNPEPSHHLFLQSAADFLSHPADYASVKRDGCAVLFANTAGRVSPGKCSQYGHSALVYSLGSFSKCDYCPPSYCACGKLLRKTDALGNCVDVVLRERGECVHICSVVPSKFLDKTAAGKTPPLRNVHVFQLRDGLPDPRVPNAPVPAVGKWVQDQLDDIHSRPGSAPAQPHPHLSTLMAGAHEQNRIQLRGVASEVLERRMRMAGALATLPDEWGTPEENALEHMISTLAIVGLGWGPLDLHGCLFHGLVSTMPQRVELLAVRANTYEGCAKAVTAHVGEPRSKTVVVCRDAANSLFLPEFVSQFTQPVLHDPGQELLNADAGVSYKGYQDILTSYIKSQTKVALRGALDEHLNS